MILCGTVFVSFFDDSFYSASASRNGDSVSYSFTTAGADTYGVTVVSGPSVSHLYLYADDRYGDETVRGSAPVGSTLLTPDRFMNEFETIAKERGFSDISVVDAQGLKTLCSDTSSASGKAVVCVSGLLPDTVYDGTSSSLMISWLSAGGVLYWAGNYIGLYGADADGHHTTYNEGYELFVGADAVFCRNEDGYASEPVGSVTGSLGLRGSGTLFAPATASVAGCMTAGYTDGTYSTITFSPVGSGSVCILSGGLVFNHYRDLAQLVCSGYTYGSELVGSAAGTVSHTTIDGTIAIPSGTGTVTVYTFLGKGVDNTVYGRVFTEAP